MSDTKIDEILETVRYLKDRQDILDCIMREVRGRDRHDEDLTRSCYWEDGFDEHGPSIMQGPEYPARANAGHAAFFSMTTHNITSHTCEIDGATANCETYVVGTLLSKDGGTCTFAPGRYIDRLEKREGEWRILHRRCTVDMSLEGSAEWVHGPAVKGFLRPTWDKDDISYKRPIAVGSDGPRWGDGDPSE
ncbi:nuclear transport factor 2 family protein [Pontixanthobacter aquaemixtae]|uniref:Nuclear transport factor 2 family protein n=1 Tax=Pontixanthobacter aquaemixtae TaxID=1958940 RepID=A0A844ZRI9_9SPHN|nr:nuclear transport factor 2 family protein [Pontixanthobacter aquaemixtae]MXO89932.1 nuclear transport factor 2 family protein [Pontixanthobacter aquaemixtae]